MFAIWTTRDGQSDWLRDRQDNVALFEDEHGAARFVAQRMKIVASRDVATFDAYEVRSYSAKMRLEQRLRDDPEALALCREAVAEQRAWAEWDAHDLGSLYDMFFDGVVPLSEADAATIAGEYNYLFQRYTGTIDEFLVEIRESLDADDHGLLSSSPKLRDHTG